jgi:uncharacterized membrane protein YgcG
MTLFLIVLAVIVLILSIRYGFFGLILDIIFAILGSKGGDSSSSDSSGSSNGNGFGGGDSGGGGASSDW